MFGIFQPDTTSFDVEGLSYFVIWCVGTSDGCIGGWSLYLSNILKYRFNSGLVKGPVLSFLPVWLSGLNLEDSDLSLLSSGRSAP